MSLISRDDLEKGIKLMTTDTFKCVNGHEFSWQIYSHPRDEDNLPKCPICMEKKISELYDDMIFYRNHTHELIDYVMGKEDYDTTPKPTDSIYIKHLKGIEQISREYEASLEKYVEVTKEYFTRLLTTKLNFKNKCTRYDLDTRVLDGLDTEISKVKEFIQWRFK